MTEIEALKKQIEQLKNKLAVLEVREIAQGGVKISKDEINDTFKLSVLAETTPSFGSTRGHIWRTIAYSNSTSGIAEKIGAIVESLESIKKTITESWPEMKFEHDTDEEEGEME